VRALVTIFEELVPSSGGGTPRISNIIKALVRKGHEVYVASSIGVKKREAVSHLGCADLLPLLSVSRLSPNKMVKYLYAHPLNIGQVVRYAMKIKPHLVISHNSIAGFAALLAKRFQKDCLVVLDLTDLLFEYLKDYHPRGWMKLAQLLGKHLEKKTIRESDKIITISNSMKDILLVYGAQSENVEVVCDGVDTKIFKPTYQGELRNRFGKNAENIVIFQGVIDSQDSPEIITHAAKEVVKKHRGTTFWIVGNGTAVPILKQEVTESNLTRHFYFSGWVKQEEVARYVSASDIGLVILPNSLSARGRVTLKEFEYWACAIPVIAPRLPALEEVVEEGKTGFFYEPENHKDLAEKINLLIEDNKLKKEMGKRGMRVVEDKYEWEKLADQFVGECEIYQG
jgi:glycosyltransferase involved in cell wall biosynthesis